MYELFVDGKPIGEVSNIEVTLKDENRKQPEYLSFPKEIFLTVDNVVIGRRMTQTQRRYFKSVRINGLEYL